MKNIIRECKQGLTRGQLVTIIQELALAHPASVMRELEAALGSNGDCLGSNGDWKHEAKEFYALGKRVTAIRECRKATGWGLREAKEYCDRHFPGPDGVYY